jgi:hypothetical protein
VAGDRKSRSLRKVRGVILHLRMLRKVRGAFRPSAKFAQALGDQKTSAKFAVVWLRKVGMVGGRQRFIILLQSEDQIPPTWQHTPTSVP